MWKWLERFIGAKKLYPLPPTGDKSLTKAALAVFTGSHNEQWTKPATDAWCDLTEAQIRYMNENAKCCYCKIGDLYTGPRGGMSVNYACGNPDCAARFNMMEIGSTPFIPWGQYTGTMPQEFIDRQRAAQGKK